MTHRRIFSILSTAFLVVILGCGQPGKIKVTEKMINEATWHGICYQPDTGMPAPTLLIATLGEYNEDHWREFGLKIAKIGFAVIMVNAGRDPGSNSLASYRSVITDAVNFLRSQPMQKPPFIAMGENQAAIACILTAANDPSIAGIITLGTFFDDFHDEIQPLLDSPSPRPLLIISSMDDELVPQKSIQSFYDKIKGPKKLVWLATPAHGSEVLRTDMEPIVRRVTVLFLEKYTKQ